MKQQSQISVFVLCACLGFVPQSPAGEDPFQGVGSITVPLEKMSWRKQAPDPPQRIDPGDCRPVLRRCAAAYRVYSRTQSDMQRIDARPAPARVERRGWIDRSLHMSVS